MTCQTIAATMTSLAIVSFAASVDAQDVVSEEGADPAEPAPALEFDGSFFSRYELRRG